MSESLIYRTTKNNGDFDMKYFEKVLLEYLREYSMYQHDSKAIPARRELKMAALHLCKAYRSGVISEDLFENTVSNLIASYLELATKEKLCSFSNTLNEKAFGLISQGGMER